MIVCSAVKSVYAQAVVVGLVMMIGGLHSYVVRRSSVEREYERVSVQYVVIIIDDEINISNNNQ